MGWGGEEDLLVDGDREMRKEMMDGWMNERINEKKRET